MDAVAKTEAIDRLRFWSVGNLDRSLPALREDLDRFAKARRAQLQEWSEFKAPTAFEGASAAVDLVSDTATKGLEAASGAATAALVAAGESIDRISGFFGRSREKSTIRWQEKASETEKSD